MRIFKWGFKFLITVVMVFAIVFSFTYASILLPISPWYIDWEEPSPIFEQERPIYI